MSAARPQYEWLIFGATLCCLLLLSALFYSGLETWFPSHIHAWTQSDRLALAYGFLDHGFNFFLPRTSNVFTPDGITGVDFPIHEYIVALLMKISGSRDPLVFRLYTLTWSLVGYSFLYFGVSRYTSRAWKGGLAVLFTFTLPIIAYYQFGFIPSATSFASFLIGFFYFMKYASTGMSRDIAVSALFITLAAMSRMSCNILLVALGAVLVIQWYQKKKVDRAQALIMCLAVIAVMGSIAYKTYLNNAYGSRFLTVLMPASSDGEISFILREMWTRWRLQFATIYHWILMGMSVLALGAALLRRGVVAQADRVILLWCGLIFTGSVMFWFALAKQFVAHEYYFLDSLYPAFVILLVAGLKFVPRRGYIWNLLTGGFIAGCLVGCVYDSNLIQNEKYAPTDWDRGEVTRKNYSDASALMDSIGIEPEARMLVLEPYSTNAPLLLMERRGYTVLRTTPDNIERALLLPFEYLVCQDIYLVANVMHQMDPGFASCLQRVGGNGKISVFRYDESRCGVTPPENMPDAVVSALGSRHRADFAGSVGQVDTTSMFNNAESIIRSDVTYGISFQYYRIDTTHFTDVAVTLNVDTSEIRREGGHACDVVMSVEGVDGIATVFESQRVELKDFARADRAYHFRLPSRMPPDGILRCYVWNRYGQDIPLTEMHITLIARNSSN